MLISYMAVRWAVTKAVDLLESEGAESALAALKALRDEIQKRIEFEEGTSDLGT